MDRYDVEAADDEIHGTAGLDLCGLERQLATIRESADVVDFDESSRSEKRVVIKNGRKHEITKNTYTATTVTVSLVRIDELMGILRIGKGVSMETIVDEAQSVKMIVGEREISGTIVSPGGIRSFEFPVDHISCRSRNVKATLLITYRLPSEAETKIWKKDVDFSCRYPLIHLWEK